MFDSFNLSTEETAQYYKNNARARQLGLLIVCVGAMMGPMSLATVNIATPSIAAALNADAVLVSWLPTSFLLVIMMVMLPMGKAADRYGRRRLFILGMVLTALFSALASLSQNIYQLLAMRSFQGFSMAMVFGNAAALISSIYASKGRGGALGFYSASVFAALTAAPLLAGWVTEAFGWRAVFLMNIPIALVVTLGLVFGIKGDWRNDEKVPFDWTGSAIFAFSTVCFVVGLIGLPKMSSLFTLVISFVALALFLYHQGRIEHPLVKLDLLTKNKLFSFSIISSTLIACANYPTNFLLSLFIQIAMGLSPIQAGQVLFIQALVIAISSPITGKLSDFIQPRYLATLGCCMLAVGFFLFSRVTPGMGAGALLIGQICVGLGLGAFITPNTNAAMTSIDQKELGFASSSIGLSRTTGNLTGISMAGLLIFLLIGPVQFTPELTEELTSTLHFWMHASMFLAISAALFSFFRGKTKKI